MSVILIIERTRYSSTKSYIVLLTLFVIITTNIHIVTFTTANEEPNKIIETINVKKCKGSKLSPGFETLVPSYAFNSEVILRIKDDDPFPGCGSTQGILEKLSETQLTYLTGKQPKLRDSEIQDLESFTTTIGPQGILNIKNRFYDVDEYCIFEYTAMDTEVITLKLQYCPQKCSNSEEDGSQLCIQKCCPPGKVVVLEGGHVHGYRCEFSGNNSWSGFFYDETSWKPVSKISKHLNKIIKRPHYFNEPMNDACNGSYYAVIPKRVKSTYLNSRIRLLTNGRLIYISANRSWTLLHIPKQKFCIDGIQNFDYDDSSPYYSGDERDQVVFICAENFAYELDDKFPTLYICSIFLASLFYLATTIVYILLRDNQNTQGWIVFSIVLSQFFMYFFLAKGMVEEIFGGSEIKGSGMCFSTAILTHFFILTSYIWLAVLTFDLWSKFRSFRFIPLSGNPRNVNWEKFCLYSFIGWGAPLIVVIVGIVLDLSYPDRESLVIVPEYGKYNCYIARWAQGHYIFCIMAFALVITMTLSIITCWKLLQAKNDPSTKISIARDQKIFFMYVKLSSILGTCWVFEFISWAITSQDRTHWIWAIFDMFNVLTSILVFIILVCNKTTLTQLVEKYPKIAFISKSKEGNVTEKTDTGVSLIGHNPSKV